MWPLSAINWFTHEASTRLYDPKNVHRSGVSAERRILLLKCPAFCRKPLRLLRNVPLPNFLREHPDGALLSIKLQPRASKNELGEPLGDELKIKVTAPPVDAAANEALIELLAKRLDCARGRIELMRGHKSRHKAIKLHGFKPEEVLQRISPASSSAG